MKPLLFIDVETTGLTPQDRLCQVAYAIQEPGEQCFYVSEYFKPPVSVSIDAMCVNHITNTFLADKDVFQQSFMFPRLAQLLTTHTLVAHNAPFDIDMLEREGLTVQSFICTKKLAKHLNLADKNSLQYLRYALELDVPDAIAHTAEGDVLVLHALFTHIRNTSSLSLEEMIQISK